MNILKTLSRGISGKTALIVLSVVVILHLSLMYFYMQSNRDEQRLVRHDEMTSLEPD